MQKGQRSYRDVFEIRILDYNLKIRKIRSLSMEFLEREVTDKFKKKMIFEI